MHTQIRMPEHSTAQHSTAQHSTACFNLRTGKQNRVSLDKYKSSVYMWKIIPCVCAAFRWFKTERMVVECG